MQSIGISLSNIAIENKKLNKSKIIYRHSIKSALNCEYVCRWKSVPWILIIWSFHAVTVAVASFVYTPFFDWITLYLSQIILYMDWSLFISYPYDAPLEWWFYGEATNQIWNWLRDGNEMKEKSAKWKKNNIKYSITVCYEIFKQKRNKTNKQTFY